MRPPGAGVLPVLIGTILICGAAIEASAQGRFVIIDEPQGTAVGVAAVVSAGSAWELRQELGVSHLTARSIAAEVQPLVEELGGELSVRCDRFGTRLTLALPAATWEEGTEYLLEALFERPPSAEAIERARSSIMKELWLAEGSNSAEIRTALAAAEYGEDGRWARPACGTRETIAALGVATVQRLAATRFTPHRTIIAIAGPVGEAAPRALLGRYLPETELPLLLPAPTPTRQPARVPERLERNTVTTWVGLSFPFPADTDLEAVRLLAFALERQVAPAPTRPELYDATVEVTSHGAGGAIVIYLITAPPQAEHWIERVRALIADLSAEELAEPVFEGLRRRYTGNRLLGLERPESRAEDAALQLFYKHTYRPPADRIEALTPTVLHRAAAALGPPVTVLLGPR